MDVNNLLPTNAPKSVWGPKYWKHLHMRAIYWPNRAGGDQVAAEHAYLRDFFSRLPCENCCQHARSYYWQVYPDLRSNETYHVWVFALHDRVNSRLGKQEFQYGDYLELYRPALVVNKLI